MAKSAKELNAVLSSASKLASYNMMLQLSFRVLTFLLNAFMLRYVTKDVLGVVNVRLLLLYSTVLFLSREAFRRACLSTEVTSDNTGKSAVRWTQTINLLWCIIPVGLLFTCFGVYCWIELLEIPDPSLVPNYRLAVFIFGFCSWIELTVEPLWVLAQAFLFVKLKVVCEGLAILAKSITIVPLVVFFPQWGVISFCTVMVVFSITYISIYYGYFMWFIASGKAKKFDQFPLQNVSDIFPKRIPGEPMLNSNDARLTFSFIKQSVLKQFLTEGEKYVMTILNVLSFSDQGQYDVINNIGSLAARFLFLPIEESFYLFFTKTLKRGERADKQPQDQMRAITNVLFCLLRFVVLIGAIILSFGIPYSYLLLDIYGGSILSGGTGPLLLKVYCVYVLAIAINGTTECFVFAAMSQSDVERYNKKMLLFSLLFLTSSYYLTRAVGSVGFILANSLNMFVRIVHSIVFIRRFYSKSSIPSPLHGILISPSVVIALLISGAVCAYSEFLFCCNHGWFYRFTHIGVGALCLGIVAIIIWFSESEVISFLQKQYFSKFNTKKSE